MGVAVQLALLRALAGPLGYLPATVASVTASIVHNFTWHRAWTWAGRARPGETVARHLTRFAAANGIVSLAGNLIVMATLVGGLHVDPLLSNLMAIALCGGLNFWLGETLVFVTSAAGRTSGPTTSRRSRTLCSPRGHGPARPRAPRPR